VGQKRKEKVEWDLMESGMAGSEFENWNLFYMFLTKEVIQDNLRYKYFVYFSWSIFKVPIRLSNLLNNVSKNKFDFKNFSLNKLLI
jgi:hypothetical protein